MDYTNWTRKERFDEWTRLLDLPMDYDRPLTPEEDAQRLELEGLLFTKTEAPLLPVEIMQAQDEPKTPVDGIRAHIAKQTERRAAEDAAPNLHSNAHVLNMWFNFFKKHARPDLARAIVAAGDMTPELHAQWLTLNRADTRRNTRLSSIENY